MNRLGSKIAGKRKDMGITQQEFADRLSVTRQTVSRWEAGTVFPDIDKIADIAKILEVSCDYLLRDDIEEDELRTAGGERGGRDQVVARRAQQVEAGGGDALRVAEDAFHR